MPKLTVQLVTVLAFAGLSLGVLPSAKAQARDANPARPEPITEVESLPAPGDDSAESSAPAELPGAVEYTDQSSGQYPTASYQGPGSLYMPNGGTPIRQGKEWYGYQNQGPWMRPIHRRIHTVPVQYARYWPSSYYTGGYDPRAQYAQPLPMVYQPTDTTQLGFYYQRVPQWQPRPNAIPGPPWPPNWHYTVPVYYQGQDPGMNANSGVDSYYGQAGYGNSYGSSSWSPANEGQVIETQPAQGQEAPPRLAVPEEKSPLAPAPANPKT